MPIQIKGAKEHNLDIENLTINDGLTVVTGVSGSGKSSLVFNTIYYEANRLFHETFGLSSKSKFNPAMVDEITGLKPSIAIDQNILNRNPNSTLVTSSGLHPLLRILYTKFGARFCSACHEQIKLFFKEEIIDFIAKTNAYSQTKIEVQIVKKAKFYPEMLVNFLQEAFPNNKIEIREETTNVTSNHHDSLKSIYIEFYVQQNEKMLEIREILYDIEQLGVQTIVVNSETYSWGNSCPDCNTWLPPLEPKLFHASCPSCKGKKCSFCNFTGYHPLALTVEWQKHRIDLLLQYKVNSLFDLFLSVSSNDISERLKKEILNRLHALIVVGLDYLELNRPMPTLSRGESQRVRLALALINNLEDMVYILDEPTIGLHIKNVLDIMPEFHNLKGSTLFVEHDKIAAAAADYAIDIGPGAGINGGKVVFSGTTSDLWKSSTTTGKYFSGSISDAISKRQIQPEKFLIIEDSFLRNLKHFNVSIPLDGYLTVVTGVSGSGKTTFVRDVLFASLSQKQAVGCKKITPTNLKAILVDQSPIGKNPRSNPATYTKLADLIREAFSKKTGLSASYFSFNNQDGACSECNGLGSLEVKMTYLPSTWVQCEVCQGKKFNELVLQSTVQIKDAVINIDDILSMSIDESSELLLSSDFFDAKTKKQAHNIFKMLKDIGLGYLHLGQPSPTLSGGEAQRIKLTKFLGKNNLTDTVLVLDEPSTGLHPADITGLLKIFTSLLQHEATIIVIEHNSDIIKSADWIIDLGPGSGDTGGELLYSGHYEDLHTCKRSITREMLTLEQTIKPMEKTSANQEKYKKNKLSISHAKVNNLKDISIDLPKNALTVITGVSGSGKSSLVSDIIEIEAKRRFLESLSMYERQSIHEKPEVDAEIEGLGVTFSIQAKKERYYLRNTVGYATDLSQQFAILYSQIGDQYCDSCDIQMKKQDSQWICSNCSKTYVSATPRHFSPRNYSSACLNCHGIGSKSVPEPEKLIINPEKPLCKGAMYSPGFFPKGYLCKEGNGGYYWLRAVGNLYNFDPEITPWNDMTEEAKNAFLFGTDDILEYESFGLKGNSHTVKEKNRGFYGFIREWDVGGTYTNRSPCPMCNGAGLRPQYMNIKIDTINYATLQQLSLEDLIIFIKTIEEKSAHSKLLQVSYNKIVHRLEFLCRVGLGYLSLQRTMGTLSAGEAQRIKLASLLGSNLHGLTITLDEPTRGMHPSEVDSLIVVLHELATRNNTLLVIEHDLQVIKDANYLIELGPKSGAMGGQIVNKGTFTEFCKNNSLTTKWLLHKIPLKVSGKPKKFQKFLNLYGATENNLKGDLLQIPLDCLVGICGVSGSGKSTLIIDTLGRIISPEKHTTSVAYEPLQPGKYESIEGIPEKSIIIDQVKENINNPLAYLELDKILIELYKDSDDFIQSELPETVFNEKCSVCKGDGILKSDMGFLPPIYSICDTCSGTGLIAELRSIKLHGYSLPDLFIMTFDEVSEIFDDSKLATKLDVIRKLGLGYLVLRQPSYSLSGGEVQRLKITKELLKKKSKETLFILDEPSLGLHMEDIEKLMTFLNSIVKEKNTVLIIEHNASILAQCDWLIELGPTGGEKGGFIINTGSPHVFITHDTPTSKYIKELLENND